MKIIKADNAKEFKEQNLINFYDSIGVLSEFSAKYLHEENGRAESSNKVILYSARALLKTAKVSPTYWSYAVTNAIFQSNCIAPVGSSLIPFEAFYNRPAPVTRLRIFVSTGYAFIPVEARRKMNDTSINIRVLGYFLNSNEYIVQEINNNYHIYNSRTVKLNEEKAY